MHPPKDDTWPVCSTKCDTKYVIHYKYDTTRPHCRKNDTQPSLLKKNSVVPYVPWLYSAPMRVVVTAVRSLVDGQRFYALLKLFMVRAAHVDGTLYTQWGWHLRPRS